MAVTSLLRSATDFGEVMVQDWQTAGLLKSSVIKPVITTIEQSLIIRAMGKLAQGDEAALRRAITSLIG